jgi:hypothetical protein
MYIHAMVFEGQVWFDFSTPAVWQFYRFVRGLAEAGHSVHLEWLPRPVASERAAMGVFVHLDTPDLRGRFLHAMLGLVHLEGADASDDTTVAMAAAAADVPMPDDPGPADRELERLGGLARDLGVGTTPALYRHGPVMTVTLNGAALMGDPAPRAQLILDVLDDDGVWGLVKP